MQNKNITSLKLNFKIIDNQLNIRDTEYPWIKL